MADDFLKSLGLCTDQLEMALLERLAEKLDHFDPWEIYRVLTHATVWNFASNYHVFWQYKFAIGVYLCNVEASIDMELLHEGLLVDEQTDFVAVDLDLDVFDVQVFNSVHDALRADLV